MSGNHYSQLESQGQSPVAARPASAIDRLMRLQEVRDVTGLGRNTIHRWGAEGRFPLPVSLGGGRVAWRETHVRAWVESRPRATSVRVNRGSVPWEPA